MTKLRLPQGQTSGSADAERRQEGVSDLMSNGEEWRPIAHVRQRVDDALAVSEDGAYMELLASLEFLMKASTAALVAAVELGDDKLCQGFEWTCIRDSGLFQWQEVLAELMTGKLQVADNMHYEKSAQLFNRHLPDVSRTYTEKVSDGDWRFEVVNRLDRLRVDLGLSFNKPGAKPSLLYWFQNFHVLRNEARGHGLPDVHKRLGALEDMRAVQDLLIRNLPQFSWPLFYVMPTLPSRSVIRPLSANCPTRLQEEEVTEGLHLLVTDEIVPFRLMTTDRGLDRFYLPNGQYQAPSKTGHSEGSNRPTYQALCYSVDLRVRRDASRWGGTRPILDDSVTSGRRTLDSDNNLPPSPAHYVPRETLEEELQQRLENDRDHVVTLMGRGGIGKTTLALHVIHEHLDYGRFANRIWLSARTADLEDDHRYDRPKAVRRQVGSIEEVAVEFARLVEGAKVDMTTAPDLMQEYVSDKDSLAPILVVFDNFETVDDPMALYDWIEASFRSPNKALITTRVEDFKGDWKIDVRGMEREEFAQLVRETAIRRHLSDRITELEVEELFRETGGHPYVAQVILAEAERTGRRVRRPRTLMATKDEILEALFGAIYGDLDEESQRVFLVAALMKSVLPKWQLEALLLRPGNELRVDVIGAIETLCRASLLEVLTIEPERGRKEVFLYTPMAASAFADKVWKRGTLDYEVKDAIDDDLRAAQQFRPVLGLEQVPSGFALPFKRFARALSGDIAERGRITDDEEAILDYLCDHWPVGWPTASEIYLTLGKSSKAIQALNGYLAAFPNDWDRWKELSRLQRNSGALAAQGRTLLQGALAAHRPADRRLRILEAADTWLALAQRGVYEPSRVRSMARQFVDGLDISVIQYEGADDVRVIKLLIAGQRKDDARKRWRDAGGMHSERSDLKALRDQLF